MLHYNILCYTIVQYSLLHYTKCCEAWRVTRSVLFLKGGSDHGRFPQLRSSNFRFESLKSEQINCGFCLTRCRISICQGLCPNKHDDISEIDRTKQFEGITELCTRQTTAKTQATHIRTHIRMTNNTHAPVERPFEQVDLVVYLCVCIYIYIYACMFIHTYTYVYKYKYE